LVGFGTALSGCVIERSELEDGDAFTTEDAGRDARIPNDVRGNDAGRDVGMEVPSDSGNDVGTDGGPRPDGLIAWWEFTSMPTMLTDSTTNGNTLVTLGTMSPGVMNNELQLRAGRGLYAPSVAQAAAVSVWIYAEPRPSVGTRYAIVGSPMGITMNYDDSSNVTCTLPSGENVTVPTGAASVWHLMTCAVEGAQLKLYIDGEAAVAVPVLGAEPVPMPGPVYVGAGCCTLPGVATTNSFIGRLDDVRLYRVAPAADRVADLFTTTAH
jgi:hypothetical protein